MFIRGTNRSSEKASSRSGVDLEVWTPVPHGQYWRSQTGPVEISNMRLEGLAIKRYSKIIDTDGKHVKFGTYGVYILHP